MFRKGINIVRRIHTRGIKNIRRARKRIIHRAPWNKRRLPNPTGSLAKRQKRYLSIKRKSPGVMRYWKQVKHRKIRH